MPQKIEVKQTEDGSVTLYLPDMDENYHSTHGALTESQHIFIKMGLEKSNAEEPRILEVGLGTGLNALLTCIWAYENKKKIHYWGYELYPLKKNVVEQLNYSEIVQHPLAAEFFSAIHAAEWGTETVVQDFFVLHKRHEDILQSQFETKFDVVYFDAFAPNKQDEMWNQRFFDSISAAMNPGAVYSTYCVKGTVKRMLKAAGLQIKKEVGPPGGKREILTAFKAL